jgi:hypothetical protein
MQAKLHKPCCSEQKRKKIKQKARFSSELSL